MGPEGGGKNCMSKEKGKESGGILLRLASCNRGVGVGSQREVNGNQKEMSYQPKLLMGRYHQDREGYPIG